MYIGEKQVKEIDGTTVLFEDGSQQVFTDRQLQYVVTDESKDLSAFRVLIMDNILPEIEEALKIESDDKATDQMLRILELHDVTNAEFQSILFRVSADHTGRHNDFLKEKVGKEIEEYKTQHERIKDISKVVSDSYVQGFYVSQGKAYGTFREGEPAENFVDNIRISDIKRLMQS